MGREMSTADEKIYQNENPVRIKNSDTVFHQSLEDVIYDSDDD